MNKEKVQERIAQLESQKQEVFNTFQALHGALQDCYYWLSQIEQEENNGST